MTSNNFLYQAIEGHPTMIVRDITKEECEERIRKNLAFRIVQAVSFDYSPSTGRIYHCLPAKYDPKSYFPDDLVHYNSQADESIQHLAAAVGRELDTIGVKYKTPRNVMPAFGPGVQGTRPESDESYRWRLAAAGAQ